MLNAVVLQLRRANSKHPVWSKPASQSRQVCCGHATPAPGPRRASLGLVFLAVARRSRTIIGRRKRARGGSSAARSRAGRHLPSARAHFTGRNVYRSSLLRYREHTRVRRPRAGHLDGVIAFAKGHALERCARSASPRRAPARRGPTGARRRGLASGGLRQAPQRRISQSTSATSRAPGPAEARPWSPTSTRTAASSAQRESGDPARRRPRGLRRTDVARADYFRRCARRCRRESARGAGSARGRAPPHAFNTRAATCSSSRLRSSRSVRRGDPPEACSSTGALQELADGVAALRDGHKGRTAGRSSGLARLGAFSPSLRVDVTALLPDRWAARALLVRARARAAGRRPPRRRSSRTRMAPVVADVAGRRGRRGAPRALLPRRRARGARLEGDRHRARASDAPPTGSPRGTDLATRRSTTLGPTARPRDARSRRLRPRCAPGSR
jgi:hypothetical protein